MDISTIEHSGGSSKHSAGIFENRKGHMIPLEIQQETGVLMIELLCEYN